MGELIDDIKNLNLSVGDFDLIIDGLRNLPNVDGSADMMIEIMASATLRGQALEDFKRKKEEKKLNEADNKKLLKERTEVIKGKMIQLKHHLVQQQLINETDSLLGNS